MKPSVSDRTITTAGLVAGLLVLWALLEIPGAPWVGFVAVAASLVVVTTTTLLCLGRRSPALPVPATLRRKP